MKTKGFYKGAQRSLDGDLIVSFAIADEAQLEWLEKTENQELVIEAKRYREPRSLSANNYFWKLCELIAQKMGSTQDEVHDLMLYRYGVRGDMTFPTEMLPAMLAQFDIVKELRRYKEYYSSEGSEIKERYIIEARCWVGSRFYNTEEMARLIDGTVNDAKEQGVDLLDPNEIERLVKEWKGDGYAEN